MNIKLLNEQNLEFLSLREGYTDSSESIHVKMPIVGNHMSRLICHSIRSIVIYPMSVTIETWRVSIPDSCTFHINLTCRNATNHCPRASIPSKHGCRGLQCRYSPLKDIVCKLRYIVANILWRNDQTISIIIKYAPLSYRTGGNRKRSEQSMNAVHKSLETVFSIAICHQSGNKRQSKTLFLTILDLRSSIVL